jgi:hypothetical protein
MAGVPLLNGFLSKEMFFAETVAHPQFEALDWALPLFATIAGMLAVAYSSALCARRLLQWRADRPAAPAARAAALDARADRAAGPALSAGRPVFPAGPSRRCSTPPLAATLQAPLPEFELALWHGFNQPLMMSLLALAGGVIIYALRASALRLAGTVAADAPAHRLRALLPIARRCCARVVAVLDNGSLQRYNALLFSFVVLLGGWAFFSGPAATIRLPASRPTKPPTRPCSRCCSGSGGRHAAVSATLAGGHPGQRRRAGRGADLRAPVGTRSGADPVGRGNRDHHPDAAGALLSAGREAPQSSARLADRDLLLALLRRRRHGLITLKMLAAPFETISGFYLRKKRFPAAAAPTSSMSSWSISAVSIPWRNHRPGDGRPGFARPARPPDPDRAGG